MSEVTSTQANKGMKQTSVEHIGRSQLIPGVRRTDRNAAVRRAMAYTPAHEQPESLSRLSAIGRSHAAIG